MSLSGAVQRETSMYEALNILRHAGHSIAGIVLSKIDYSGCGSWLWLRRGSYLHGSRYGGIERYGAIAALMRPASPCNAEFATHRVSKTRIYRIMTAVGYSCTLAAPII
jgi:hypothetical protein